MEQSDH
jgi:hypothetical protein